MDLPRPEPRSGEVLVRIAAAGMNPFDWKIVDGILDGKMPHQFPLVVGSDGAGTVEELGEGVQRFVRGDSIYGQFLHSPVGIGTYAEYAAVPDRIGVSKAPRTVDAIHAAAAPTAGMTALEALDELRLLKGQTLLIVGATGGVGSFAVQLAARGGLKVIATARTDAAEYVRSMGATETIDHTRDSVVNQVRASHPEGVDGLLDCASDKAGFASNISLLRSGGVAATTTFAADVEVLQRIGIRGVNIDMQPTAALLGRLTQEIDDHGLRAPVESVISLAEAPAAFARLRTGRNRGKTVVVVRPPLKSAAI